MKRLTGLLAIFLTLPFLLGSHAPADVFSESGNAADAGYCPSATVQMGTGSGFVYRTSSTGTVGACRYWSILYKSPVGGPQPTYFFVYEIHSNGTATEISSAMCTYSCSGGRGRGTVSPTSSILIIGLKQAGAIGGAVAELDTAPW